MPDFLDFLRLRNIFNPGPIGNDLPSQGGITGNMPRSTPPLFGQPTDIGLRSVTPPTIGRPMNFETDYQYRPDQYQPAYQYQPTNDIASQVAQLYTPETQMTERFNTILGQYPQREQPSRMRRIAASMVAPRGGLDDAERVLAGSRFRGQLEDWKNQIGPLGQAVSNERMTNVNERILAMQTIANELRAQAMEAKEKNDEINARIRQQRADVYEFKARNPNMRFDLRGPTIKMMNPLTGQISDTGIPTGILSQADRMTLEQENALERIAATGEQARQTEGVRQSGRESIAETRGWQIYNVPDPARPGQMKAVKINQITGEVADITDKVQKPVGPAARPSGAVTGAGGRPELPTQTKVRQYNAARELYNTRADLRKFIQLGSPETNDFIITPPKKSNFMGFEINSGPTPEQYKEMSDIIYGMTPMSSRDITGRNAPSGKPRLGSSVVEPSGGAPPPMNKRTVGMRHTFPNGNIGEWDGTKWIPIKIVAR